MPKKSKKSKSKRVPLRRKYKILKKVKEHARKKNREAKKELKEGKKKRVKDPGIPNQWPFKEQLLKEIEHRQEVEKAKKEKRREENRKRREEDLERIKENAEARTREYEDMAVEHNLSANGDTDNTRSAFYKVFHKVVEYSDVLIQVLDARDPLGCRCTDIERLLARQHPNKKLIILLNKADLVPKENLQKWLKYLRQEYPTLAFKCSTQKQSKNLGQKNVKGSAEKFDGSTESIGAVTLLQLLKNYARNQNIKTAITVGVFGLPNVGKSSLINSLLRTRAVATGSTPGVTTNVQEVHLDKHVKLLDCPGIVFAAGTGDVQNALLNAVKIEKLEDPREAVYEIIKRVSKRQLMQVFKVATFKNGDEFLERVAQARGKLLRGGLSDSKTAAKLVLQDWNGGKIPFFTTPPERSGQNSENVQIVNNWGAEFNADAVYKDEEFSLLAKLSSLGTSDATWVEAKPSEPLKADLQKEVAEDLDDDSDDGGEMEIEESGKSSGMNEMHEQNKILYSHDGQHNPKLARALKKKRQKAKKSKMDTDEYDFEEFFD